MLKKLDECVEIRDESYNQEMEELLYMTYLAEKNSEHVIAKAINKRIDALISPERMIERNQMYQTKEFSNFNGEGI